MVEKSQARNVIEIELQEGNRLSYTAGDKIEGILHVTQQDKFDNIKSLVIALQGYERLTVVKTHQVKNEKNKVYSYRHKKEEPICRIEFTLAEFNLQQVSSGMFDYPFTIETPKWLPPSMTCHSPDKLNEISLDYEICAQYEVIKPSGEQKKIQIAGICEPQSLKVCQRIYLQNPKLNQIVKVPQEITQTGEVTLPRHKMGFGKPFPFICKYGYDQLCYYSGDEMTIKIKIDNSFCDVAVRNFKVRIHRKIVAVCHTKMGPMVYKKSEIIHEGKYDGSPAKTKDDNVSLKVQLMQTISSRQELEQNQRRGVQTQKTAYGKKDLVPSFSGLLCSIQYAAIVQIKHDVPLHTGSGQNVMLPFQIMPKPSNQIINKDQQWRSQGYWNPLTLEHVQCNLPPVNELVDGYLSYYKPVMQQQKDLWEKKLSRPVILTPDEIKIELEQQKKKQDEVVWDPVGTPVPNDADVVPNDLMASLEAGYREQKQSFFDSLKK